MTFLFGIALWWSVATSCDNFVQWSWEPAPTDSLQDQHYLFGEALGRAFAAKIQSRVNNAWLTNTLIPEFASGNASAPGTAIYDEFCAYLYILHFVLQNHLVICSHFCIFVCCGTLLWPQCGTITRRTPSTWTSCGDSQKAQRSPFTTTTNYMCFVLFSFWNNFLRPYVVAILHILLCMCLHVIGLLSTQVPFAHLFLSQMNEEFTYFVQKKNFPKRDLASVEHCSDLIWKDSHGHAYIAHNEDSDVHDIGYMVHAHPYTHS